MAFLSEFSSLNNSLFGFWKSINRLIVVVLKALLYHHVIKNAYESVQFFLFVQRVANDLI